MLNSSEVDTILSDVECEVLDNLASHVKRLRVEWNTDYPPDEVFEPLERSVQLFARQ